jgi:hypothetical protein
VASDEMGVACSWIGKKGEMSGSHIRALRVFFIFLFNTISAEIEKYHFRRKIKFRC